MVEPSEPGIRRCAQCRWLFVSPDVLRICRCVDCKNSRKDDPEYEPRTVRMSRVDGRVSQAVRDTAS